MIVFDCEIVKGIAKHDEDRIPGIEYCDGWKDFDNMGISVICAYDYDEERHRVFCKDNFAAFQELINATDFVIGFNSLAFDNPLCAANDIHIPAEKSYDLLVEIWDAAGLEREFHYPSHTGYGLDACALVNFGISKSGNGAMAPVLWQRGQIGDVIDYCLNDIRLTKALLDIAIEEGGILNPNMHGADLLEIDVSRLLNSELGMGN